MRRVAPWVSLDLSHIGLLIDHDFCFENALSVATAVAAAGTEMIISAEGTDRTDDVLGMHGRLCERLQNVGITLQAHLYRTPRDLDAIIDRSGKIRIVKGAFDARPELVVARGPELDATSVALARQLDAARRPYLCNRIAEAPMTLFDAIAAAFATEGT